jgi:hypothetical protein
LCFGLITLVTIHHHWALLSANVCLPPWADYSTDLDCDGRMLNSPMHDFDAELASAKVSLPMSASLDGACTLVYENGLVSAASPFDLALSPSEASHPQ